VSLYSKWKIAISPTFDFIGIFQSPPLREVNNMLRFTIQSMVPRLFRVLCACCRR